MNTLSVVKDVFLQVALKMFCAMPIRVPDSAGTSALPGSVNLGSFLRSLKIKLILCDETLKHQCLWPGVDALKRRNEAFIEIETFVFPCDHGAFSDELSLGLFALHKTLH